MLKKKVVHILALITLVVGIVLPALGQPARADNVANSINISNVRNGYSSKKDKGTTEINEAADVAVPLFINNVKLLDNTSNNLKTKSVNISQRNNMYKVQDKGSIDSQSDSKSSRKVITATGTDADSAVITDKDGNVVSHDTTLPAGSNYNVDWNWSVPDGVSIQNGDTITINIPDNVKTNVDLDFPIENSAGEVIGTCHIPAGSSTGTITFNDKLENTNVDRKGTVEISAQGTDRHNDGNWFINKAGWFTNANDPSKITWNIAFNPKQENLGHVTITDTMSDNQEYIDGSIQAQTGTWGSDGNFIPDGGSVNVKVTKNADGTLTFDMDNVTTGVNLTYQTTVKDGSKGETYTNKAGISTDGDGTSVNSDAEIKFGGSGTGDGSNSTDTSSTTTSSTTDTTPTTDTSSTTTSSTTDTTPTTDTSSTTTTSSTTDTTPTTDTSSTTTSSSTTPSTSNPTNPNTDTSSTSTTSTDVPHSAKPDTDTDTTGTHTASVPGVNNNGGNGGHTNGKLPQTGQKDTKGLTIIGTAMLLMLLAMFGYIKVRKFNK